MKVYYFAVLFSSFILFANNSMAMGKMGHQLVCQIAVDNLPADIQHKLSQTLMAIPQKHREIINKFIHRKTNAQLSYAQACTWADAIKNQPLFKKFNAWHYMNLPREASQVVTERCKENCIIHAINFHKQQYAHHENPWIRTQSLLFLGHWYADIHQPFHVSFASDLGGNKTKVRLSSRSSMARKCDNLHWIWDECLLYLPHHKNTKQAWEEHYTALQTLWDKTPQKQHEQWRLSQAKEIANESFLLVQQPHIHYCEKKNNACVIHSSTHKTLPQDYQKTHYPELQKRLLQGAIRLHQQLLDLLSASEQH